MNKADEMREYTKSLINGTYIDDLIEVFKKDTINTGLSFTYLYRLSKCLKEGLIKQGFLVDVKDDEDFGRKYIISW